MLGVHALIGIGEGLITSAAVALVMSARPDLVRLTGRKFDWQGRVAVEGSRS
jgi:cobalt/nickel transport system permease protein